MHPRCEGGLRSLDSDGFLGASEGKREIDAGWLSHIELDAELDHGTEAFLTDRNLVDARLEGGDHVAAIGPGERGAPEAGFVIDHNDGSGGDGGIGGVADEAGQVRILLRGERDAEKDDGGGNGAAGRTEAAREIEPRIETRRHTPARPQGRPLIARRLSNSDTLRPRPAGESGR